MLSLPAVHSKPNQVPKLSISEIQLNTCRSFLLGPNGSGKTSYLKAIAQNTEDSLFLAPQQNLSTEVRVFELFDIYQVDHQVLSPLWEEKNKLSHKASELSSGERQRLLLHLHLQQKHSLQLLDEPTNFLDPYFKWKLKEELLKIDSSKHILIATHDLHWATQFQDSQFFLFAEAKLLHQGRCKNLVESPEMQKAFQMQFVLEDNLIEKYDPEPQ